MAKKPTKPAKPAAKRKTKKPRVPKIALPDCDTCPETIEAKAAASKSAAAGSKRK